MEGEYHLTITLEFLGGYRVWAVTLIPDSVFAFGRREGALMDNNMIRQYWIP